MTAFRQRVCCCGWLGRRGSLRLHPRLCRHRAEAIWGRDRRLQARDVPRRSNFDCNSILIGLAKLDPQVGKSTTTPVGARFVVAASRRRWWAAKWNHKRIQRVF